MPDYWGMSPVKGPSIQPDRYTAKPSEFVYNGQRISLFRHNEYVSISGKDYVNGQSFFTVPSGSILCVTCIALNLTDITAPAPVTTDVKFGWSDGEILYALRTEDGNLHVITVEYPQPYPEMPSSAELRGFHISAVGAPTYRGHLNLYGFLIQSSVNLV